MNENVINYLSQFCNSIHYHVKLSCERDFGPVCHGFVMSVKD